MGNRRLWVIECADKGKNNWEPLSGRCWNIRKEAREDLEDTGTLCDFYDYRLVCYVPRDDK